ncbi:HAD family hydrolase [Streptomyces sp. NPDC004111]|uniref:HAD family hydrolase n=1 Tax=Streptomyces sp. NPDC004111 TaxID=3364690 RepID=UPI003677D7C6
MHRLVLWDVDHTLVENSGISKETYAGAYLRLTGESARFAARTEGRTDRAIMRTMFEDHDQFVPRWPEVEAALTAAGRERAEALRDRGMALPGAVEALQALAAATGFVQSALTGNIRANAWMKLHAFGLDKFLDLEVGAYGADADDRADLVPVARRRAALAYPERDSYPSVLLIGDTPRDVAAAVANEVQILAVATGVHGVDELREAGAREVLEDLADTASFLGAVQRLIP